MHSELFSIPALPLLGRSDVFLDWNTVTTYMQGWIVATSLKLSIKFHGVSWEPTAEVTVNVLDLFRQSDPWRNLQFTFLIL